MCVGGRANIDPGNRWRDLNQIWYGLSLHIQEGYKLCGYVVGVAWALVGVMGNSRSDMDQIWHGGSLHPQEGYGRCGYVLGVAWAWRGRGWA